MGLLQRNGIAHGFGVLLGVILLVIATINALPIWLVADVVVAEPDTAVAYYSADGQWSEAHTVSQPLIPGMNRVALRLPSLRLGDRIRLDPGQTQTNYHVLSLRWFRGGLGVDIPLSAVANPRPDAMNMRLVTNRLELTAHDIDPQLIVPLPTLGWRTASLLWPLGVLAAIMLGALVAQWRGRLGIVGVASIFVSAGIALYLTMYAQYAARLPIFDDWRYVIPSQFDLIGGRWEWLRAVGNDTYFLTGQIIDFLVLKLSNVDFGWLRAVALMLLLLHLWAMQRILVRCMATPVATAVGIALLILTLSVNSYWGSTAIAHHQFLPVLFGSLMLLHLIARHGGIRPNWSRTLLLVLAIASGLAYISGGLFIVALAAGLLLAHADELRHRPWPPALHAGIWLLGLGIALLTLQIILVGRSQGALLDHSHVSASIYPDDRRFWLFLIGLFGRALGYAGYQYGIDAALTVLALIPVVVLGFDRVWNGFFRGHQCEHRVPVMLALYGGIAAVTYASAVAFGRAGLVAADASTEAIIWTSKARFHYWPIAAMLPFLWLGWIELARRSRDRIEILATFAAVLMLVPKSLATWDWVGNFRAIADGAARGAHCIAAQWEADPSHVVCETITGPPINLSGPLQRLRDEDRVLYRDIQRYLELPPPP